MNWRIAGAVVSWLGALGQLGIALVGYALGGLDTAVALVLAVAVVAGVGAVLMLRIRVVGLVLVAIAAAGALVGLFVYTRLEIVVAVLLLAGITLPMLGRRAT